MKKIVDIVNSNNKKIICDTDYFNYGTDALLLADFVDISSRDKYILDIGTGNAVIPILLSEKTNALITGVEIQADVGVSAVESVKLNNLEKQINIVIDDIKSFSKIEEPNKYDLITVNPPYFNSGKMTVNLMKQKARHEITLSLVDIFQIARKLLKNNGFLYIIYRAERLVDIFKLADEYNLAVKKISFIHKSVNNRAELCLIKCCKNGKAAGLVINDPVILKE